MDEMKKLFFGLTLFAMVTAACAPQSLPTQPPPPLPTPTLEPTELTPAQRAALNALMAALGLPAEGITVVSAEAVDWPDSCLGIIRPEALCAAVVTPGFRIVLEADGQRYELHTNQDGSVVAPEAPLADSTVARDAAVQALMAALGLGQADLRVVAVTAINWSDSCLGLAQPDTVCADVITPGWIVVLEAQGQQYLYHADAAGTLVRPASLALTWHREGGIAGFCDSLVVYLTGEVQASTCRPGAPIASRLTAEERQQLLAWVAAHPLDTLVITDGAVADSMTTTVEFRGQGSAATDETWAGQLDAWAQTIYNRVQP
jgi:hypothetical protein